MSKDKKKKSVIINGEKFVVLYTNHYTKEAQTGTMLGLFDVRTMENYVLSLKGDPTMSNVMTISILDMVRCVGEADCAPKHKLQKILNAIDFGERDPKEFKQLIINLAYSEEDGKFTPKIMVNYVASSDMTSAELPYTVKKKKKDDN